MKRLLLIICFIFTAATADGALVYQATLQDDTTGTTVVAATGTNGVLSGATNTSDISEDVGPGGSYTKALHFDNVNDYVDVGTDASFPDGSEVRTVCFWFRADTFNTATGDCMVGYANGAAGEQLVINAEDNAVSVAFSSHRVITPASALSTGTWYHVAVVVPSGATTTADVDVYINGVSQTLSDEAGSSQTLNTAAADVFLAAASGPSFYYDGYMADFRIYDTDESANLATIMADGQDATGNPLLLQLLLGQ